MTLAYAAALVSANRLDEAETVLQGIRLADQDARYEQLMAQIELGRRRRGRQRWRRWRLPCWSPDDHATRVKLAVQLSQVSQYREALEHLLTVLRADKDFNNGEVRKVFLDTLATIGRATPRGGVSAQALFLDVLSDASPSA
ncbi:MAG: hypothetical protein CM15mP74_19570 [Halieaceae bacterium]|nr:MAG: hypothetical protein CM15mP74_19570 [Halieaceae bacterium]